MEQNAQIRSSLTLYDLIDAENVDARAIANAMRSGDRDGAEKLAREAAPIAKLNSLLAISNIPIVIAVESGDRLVASKNGGASYGAAELSDGERNALLIAADVLTAKKDSLLIIDEPERHLHRSIISPLLTQLFNEQKDCAFIIATHDLMLPIDNPGARVLLVRSCVYQGSLPQAWETDLLSANAEIDERLKEDVVGSRRRIVFIEGDDSSLDRPLYSVLFPEVSIRAKGSSRDVEQAVNGVRSSEDVHWVKAWGIVDSDGRDESTVATLATKGIFALPFYSVEAIYYHPDVVAGVARRHALVTGEDASSNTQSALAAGVAAVEPHLERMAARAVEKTIRRAFLLHLPTLRTIEQKVPVSVSLDTRVLLEQEVTSLTAAVVRKDWASILTRCPVRETPALSQIARLVGMRDRVQYEGAVIQMLREETAMMSLARSFFGTLSSELQIL